MTGTGSTDPPAAIGIDVGGSKIEAAVLDAAGRVRWRQRVPSPSRSYDAMVEAIADLAQAARRTPLGADATIGLGTPGSHTPEGLVKNANSTRLNGRPLKFDLERRLGLPLRLANDANCLALSEAIDGAGAGAGVVFAAILGTGVGAGIVVDGRLLVGPNGLAGEWGHNPLPWRGADDPEWPCYCGRSGCIETLVSGPGLSRDHLQRTGATLGADAIAAAAAGDDDACAATMARWHHRLARALAHVINLLDPDVIVLGGGLSRIESTYRAVPALWGRWVFSGGLQDPVRTALRPALHGDASGVRGAAWLWRRVGRAGQ